MAKRNLSQPLTQITFRCGTCRHTFSCPPDRVIDDLAQEHHPYAYFAECRVCGGEAEQAAHEKNLLKAWANATGPRTPEGKAAAAANLDGHPTAEEAQRTRFNALKHGMNAKTASYFPARPDGYSFCKTCDVDRGWCHAQPACVKQTEIFLLHHAAFEQRDPKHLMGIYSGLQAAVFAVLQQILQTIIADGVKIESPEWYTTKDGECLFIEYTNVHGERKSLMNIEAHPLFKPLGELISRTGLSLSDMGMTPKLAEDEQAQMGRLAAEGATQESLLAFAQQSAESLGALKEMLQRAKDQAARDPILLEYEQQNGAQS